VLAYANNKLATQTLTAEHTTVTRLLQLAFPALLQALVNRSISLTSA
jgi:hypothetical protein